MTMNARVAGDAGYSGSHRGITCPPLAESAREMRSVAAVQ